MHDNNFLCIISENNFSLPHRSPTNERVAGPITCRGWPITAVIQLLFKLGDRIVA